MIIVIMGMNHQVRKSFNVSLIKLLVNEIELITHDFKSPRPIDMGSQLGIVTNHKVLKDVFLDQLII